MAIDFEATSSQWVDLGLNLPALNGKPAVTVMAWIRIEAFPASGSMSVTEQSINGSATSSRVFFNFGTTGGGILGIRPLDSGGSTVLNAGTLSTATWHHYCGIGNIAGDAMEIFIDGVSVGSSAPAFTPTSFPATDSGNGAIGANDNGSGQFMDGIIEDYRMYDRALSLAEIETIVASRGTDGIVAGLVQRYLLGEGAVGVAAVGAGTVKDIAETTRSVDPVASPLYAEGVNRFRRRTA